MAATSMAFTPPPPAGERFARQVPWVSPLPAAIAGGRRGRLPQCYRGLEQAACTKRMAASMQPVTLELSLSRGDCLWFWHKLPGTTDACFGPWWRQGAEDAGPAGPLRRRVCVGTFLRCCKRRCYRTRYFHRSGISWWAGAKRVTRYNITAYARRHAGVAGRQHRLTRARLS